MPGVFDVELGKQIMILKILRKMGDRNRGNCGHEKSASTYGTKANHVFVSLRQTLPHFRQKGENNDVQEDTFDIQSQIHQF